MNFKIFYRRGTKTIEIDEANSGKKTPESKALLKENVSGEELVHKKKVAPSEENFK